METGCGLSTWVRFGLTPLIENSDLNFRKGSISAARLRHERQSIIDHLGPLANSKSTFFQATKHEKRKTLADQPSERLKKSNIADALRRAALRTLKRAKAEMHARRLAAQAQLGAPAICAGVKEGSGEARRMSNAAYAAIVSAEINRHKHYPASARESGHGGTVGVVFSVGASGRDRLA